VLRESVPTAANIEHYAPALTSRPATARDTWAPARSGSRTAVTASCGESCEPAANTWSKAVRAERLADMGHQPGLRLPQHRPHPHASPLAQAISRPRQQRRPLGVALREGQPGERVQTQSQEGSAMGRQTQTPN